MIQFIPIIGEVLKQVLPDPKSRAEAEAKLGQMMLDGQLKEFESKAKIIAAEASSEHWITSAWRPITMLTFVAIIANNYILYPYLSLFWSDAPVLELPDQLWSLLQIGIGGYVASRGAEKVAKELRKSSQA